MLGSWTAGTLSTKAKVEGITVYGNDVWIVDAYSDKVYKYAGAAVTTLRYWDCHQFQPEQRQFQPQRHRD